MKNKIILVSISILVIVGLIFVLNNETKKTFVIDGIKYAVNLDGEATSTVPSKGLYEVAVTCENATGKWDYDNWKLKLTNMSSAKASCSLDFTTITKVNLNDYIISLSGQTQGTGQVVNENGYRYEGKNPNNYIWFNNELWRIIGVFDNSSHGKNDQNLVKIIRTESIGALCWDYNYTTNWNTSTLKSLLNGAYYDWDVYNNEVSNYCKATSYGSYCDYSKIGINDTYRSMVENVTWYLRGIDNNNATTEEFYNSERINGTVQSGNTAETTGYIGLMYPSDYGYSVLSSSCARTTSLGSYNTSTCAGQSWMYGASYEWTITSYISAMPFVVNLDIIGSWTAYSPDNNYSIRPVLYLSSSVYKITGDGTISNPYIIGM